MKAKTMPVSPAHDVRPIVPQRACFLNRLASANAEAVSDAELLELMLTPVSPTDSAHSLAIRLLEQFVTVQQVMYADTRTLHQIEGVTDGVIQMLSTMRVLAQRMAKSRILTQPVIESWSALMEYCTLASGYGKVEEFRVLYLDHSHRLIADEVMQRGTVNHTPIYPREIVKRALEHGAGAIILVHNHPVGDTAPSDADIAITKKIIEALATVSITVHDHVIVGPVGHYSFRASGLIKE